MKHHKLFSILIILLNLCYAYSQNSRWTIYKDLMGQNSNLWTLKIDKTNGDVWVGARYADDNLLGIAKFDSQNWHRLENFPERTYNLRVRSIAIDPDGNQWFTTEEGIYRYDGINWQSFTTDNTMLPTNNVNSVAIEPSGICWFGMNTWTAGAPIIAKYDKGEWSFFKISDFIPDAKENGYIILGVAIDSLGNRWFGGTPGVFAVDKNNQLIYSSAPEDFGTVTTIYVDKNNVVWVGAFEGLYYYDGNRMVEYALSSIHIYSVRGIVLDKNEDIWATSDKGVYRAYHGQWIEYDNLQNGLPFTLASGIDIDKSGKIWITTWSGHVAVYDPDKPVGAEIVGFRGVAYKNCTDLIWYTIEEHDNIGFTILRSDDRYGSFKKIGFVKGNLNTSELSSYTFSDFSANNYVRYRIRQESRDGSYEYSTIIDGYVGTPETTKLFQNFPNPFNNSTKIAYSLNETQHIKITIYNSLGQEIKTLVDDVQPTGRYSIDFKGDNLSSGVYYIQLITSHNIKTKKMLYLK